MEKNRQWHSTKCHTMEARKFEKKLGDYGITYDQFLELCTMHSELTAAGKAEVDNMLKDGTNDCGMDR